ncbi:MAG: FlgD immunoglobulin-like domain containing protein [Nocardioides sp.]
MTVVALALPAAATAAAGTHGHTTDRATAELSGNAVAREGADQLRVLRAAAPPTHRAGSDADQLRLARDLARQAQPEAVAAAAAPSTVPVVTSPLDGTTVAGVTSLTASTTAAAVQFTTLDLGSFFVPASAGVASTPLDTFGEVNGSHTVTAADCDALDSCNATTDGSTYTVDNGPVTLTQPADGATVGGSFVAGATSSGGRISFRVDGTEVAAVAASPYLATIDTSGLTVGSHTLTAVRCSNDGSVCGDSSATITFTVARVSPVVTSAKPSPFSPNGDGHVDTTTIGYTLDSSQQVTWRVTTRSGQTLRGPVHLGTVSGGQHSFVFNGKKNGGSHLTDGGYVVRIDTSKSVGGVTVTGSAEHAVVVDLRKPSTSGVHASPQQFYPVHDGYKDTTTVTVHTTESTRGAQLLIFNAKGHRVARVSSGGSTSLTRHLTWNGRNGGKLLKAGRYSYRVALTDRVWNTGVSQKYPLVISAKKLVRKSGTATVANPYKNHLTALIGDCSVIYYPAKKSWPGSLRYLSNYDACAAPTDTELLAVTRHQVTLPSAIRYGTVRLSTYGGRSVPGYADIGVALYEDKTGAITSKGGVLKSSVAWHGGSSVSAPSFLQGRRFRWWAGTTDSNFYDIRSFEVSYTYFVLR